MASVVTSVAAPVQAQFIKTRSFGPVPARVLICGEAPGAEEEIRGVPFVGSSGQELDRMLHEADMVRTECFLTNVCKYRPPQNKIENFFLDSKQTKPNELILEGIKELKQEIANVQPTIILAMGNTALWALTGQRGITKWRGSMLHYRYHDNSNVERSTLLMPTYHPALILREWAWRSIAVHDLRRAKAGLVRGEWPQIGREFIIRPAFSEVMDVLNTLIKEADHHDSHNPLPLASDLETRAGYIACAGIAWSRTKAICIPNMCVERPEGFFSLDQDVSIWKRERDLLTHPNVAVIGQSYLYDAQYYARRRGYVPRLRHDTRLMQHVAWPGLPQGLDFLSSMYREHHVYWKDESKEWQKNVDENRLWAYNCEDCIATYEAYVSLLRVLHRLGLYDQYRFQMRMWWSILRMMLRGIKVDILLRGRIAGELMQAMQEREGKLHKILGYQINLDSPKQVHNLFYDQLRCQVVKHQKTRRPTCDEDALKLFAHREPLLMPIVELITEVRAIGTLVSNVIQARTPDGRIRSQFSPTAESFRWTSSKDAFGDGTNLQNWTKGDEEE